MDYEVELITCSRCNGQGLVKNEVVDISTGMLTRYNGVCPKCRGKRKVDWIENIIGVRTGAPGTLSTSSTTSSSSSVNSSTESPMFNYKYSGVRCSSEYSKIGKLLNGS